MNEPRPRTVIKVGGSVLRDEGSYAHLAALLRPWLRQATWVVVSAGLGVTDALEQLVRAPSDEAVAALLDRHARWAGGRLPPAVEEELRSLTAGRERVGRELLTWGERASAAALQARLAADGIDVPVVELTAEGALAEVPAALVPGFYLRDADGSLRLLPRGGSDISAVLLAERLAVPEVRLWKNGGGLRDPADPTSTLPEVDAEGLLARLGDEIRPLHADAVRIALRAGIDLVLEEPGRPSSRVRARPPAVDPSVRRGPDPRGRPEAAPPWTAPGGA